MSRKFFWLSILAVLISFAGGFLLANAFNRRELDELRSEVGRLKSSAPQSGAQTESAQNLSEEEIRQKIAEADANPENVDYQKGLAMGLYQYSVMKQEPRWLVEVARLLTRVHDKNPRDFNTIIALGNIYFDMSQSGAESDEAASKNVGKAREFYQKALEIKPNDADARADLGITYLYENPPQNEKAIAEFQKALRVNPKDEKSLENIVRAFSNAGKTKDAAEFLNKLKQANPNNASIPDLESKLTPGETNKQ